MAKFRKELKPSTSNCAQKIYIEVHYNIKLITNEDSMLSIQYNFVFASLHYSTTIMYLSINTNVKQKSQQFYIKND